MAKTDIKPCDGMRKDGTCGNGYCKNHNKKCRGVTCPERFHYKGVGGEQSAAVPVSNYKKQTKKDVPCIHFGGDEYCADYKADKITCDQCPKWLAEHKGAVAVKEEQVEVVAAEVVEDRVTKDIAKREDAAQRTVIKKTIARQVATVQGVELRSNFEKLKLGAMVSEAVRVLNLEDPSANRGRNAAGGGALGWWADVCPRDKEGQPVIAYRTVMMWKEAAENLPLMMGEDGFEVGKMIALMAKNPKKVVGKDAKILASAEKLANGMTMRQMLLWGDDEPAKAKGKGGRPKATDEELPKLNKREEAKAIWNVLLQHVTKTSVKDAIPLLPQNETEIAYHTLRDVSELLKKHIGEF